VNGSRNRTATLEESAPSPKPKDDGSWQPRRLTPQEIASLRSDAKQDSLYYKKEFARLRPRPVQA